MQGTSGAGHLTEPQEVGCDLGKALIPRVQVEREGRQLVHKGNRFRVCGKIDVEQVLAARLTGLDPDVRKDGLLLDAAFSVDQPALQPSNDAAAFPRRRPFFIEDREARTRRFAAAWAGHPGVSPAGLTARAEQEATTRSEVLISLGEKAELGRSAAARAVSFVPRADAGRGSLRAKGFENRAQRRTRQIPLDQVLVVARHPGANEVVRLGDLEAAHDRVAQLDRAGCEADVHHGWDNRLGHVGDQSSGGWRGRSCVLKRILLNREKGAIEVQQLADERVASSHVSSPTAAFCPRSRGHSDRRHHIFSRLTRKALNSGVRALASPTKGVSALASQYRPWLGSRSAAMPT